MVAPYYADEWVTLYHGDCRHIGPSLPVGSADLMVTDPPYGVRFQSGFRAESLAPIAGDESADWAPAAIAACLPALRTFRHVYLFGRFDLSRLPLTDSVELIWDKGQVGLGNVALPWGPSHEAFYFAVYVPSAKNRDDGRGRLAARLRKGSVVRVPRLNSRAVSRHPTEKPVALVRQLIESSSVLGETVFDPFAGSGSTLVAATLEGRKAVGIELDERYCEVIAKRLSQPVLAEVAT